MTQLSTKELIIVGVLAGLILAAIGVYWLEQKGDVDQLIIAASEVSSQTYIDVDLPSVIVPKVTVHIVGAIKAPGVYHMDEGARLYEAVEKAGGFADEAAKEVINLAQNLVDGERYYLPYQGEDPEINQDPLSIIYNTFGLLNLNLADQAALESLPGIGSVRAKAILDYRERQGGFQNIEDLKKVAGIGDSVFNQIRDLVFCK